MYWTNDATRRRFLAAAATGISGVGGAEAMAALRAAEDDKALIAITLDLEMSRNFPTWDQTHWDYEKGNLDADTKRYAVEAAQRALSANRQEDIARLYLGLTLAREGDRQRGLEEIESGMRGINNFLDYINQAQRFSIGQYWDPGRDIRSTIHSDLTMISGKDLDWQQLIADTEWLGIRMEQESDLARRQEAQARSRESGGRGHR